MSAVECSCAPHPGQADELADRFWSYVVKPKMPDACWQWTAGLFVNGYGQFRAGTKKVKAHRYAWELTYGQIPEGLCVCHHCDNRRCVRPSHLFLGTQRDNAQDREHKGRGARGPNPRKGLPGEGNPAAKLTLLEVCVIRRLGQNGETYHHLSEMFGVCRSQIGNIVRGTSWRKT